MATPGRPTNALCSGCGVELLTSGNYKVRLIPARKMPKKAVKLFRNPKLEEMASQHGKSKFQKYLYSRARPRNTMEITCGTCQTTLPISLSKPKAVLKGNKGRASLTPGSSKSSRKSRKSKTPRDLNAGLIITPSMLKLATPSASFTPLTSSLGRGPSQPNSQQSSQSQPARGPKRAGSDVNSRKVQQAEKLARRKDMNSLRRVLNKSKEITPDSSPLLNFLGEPS